MTYDDNNKAKLASQYNFFISDQKKQISKCVIVINVWRECVWMMIG